MVKKKKDRKYSLGKGAPDFLASGESSRSCAKLRAPGRGGKKGKIAGAFRLWEKRKEENEEGQGEEKSTSSPPHPRALRARETTQHGGGKI